MNKQFLVFAFLMLPGFLLAKEEKQKTETITIQTSAICDGCKERIESALKEIKGVKSATLNLTDKKVTVVYQPTKVSADQIRTAISMSGYDAGDLKANPESYDKLPMCCKKE
jgi:copper chaperone CopZ